MSQPYEITQDNCINVTLQSSNIQTIESEVCSSGSSVTVFKSLIIVSAMTSVILFGSNVAEAKTGQRSFSIPINSVSPNNVQATDSRANHLRLRWGSSGLQNISRQTPLYSTVSSPSTIINSCIQTGQTPSDEIHKIELSTDVYISMDSAYAKLNAVDQSVREERRMRDTMPTFIRHFADDLTDAVTVNPIKLAITAAFGAIITWIGADVVSLVTGLFFLAVTDVVLGLIPGNIKKGTKRDEKLQAKLWGFITNVLVIVAIFKGMEYLLSVASTQAAPFLSAIVHIGVVSWLYSVYIWRLVGYAASANKTKVPSSIRKLFGKDDDKDKTHDM